MIPRTLYDRDADAHVIEVRGLEDPALEIRYAVDTLVAALGPLTVALHALAAGLTAAQSTST
jgi:hypothetical protein